MSEQSTVYADVQVTEPSVPPPPPPDIPALKTEGAAPSTNTIVYDTRKPTLLLTVQKTF